MSQRSNRCCRNLALKEDQLATTVEIAKSLGITKNRLLKVVHQLGVAGYVNTVRGRGGGLRLAKPVEAIGLGEVVHYTEQTWRSCRASNSRCALRHSAMLRVEARVGEGARCLHWCP